MKKKVEKVNKAPKPEVRRPAAKQPAQAAENWTMRLYVAGQTPKSLTAIANLKRICEQHLTTQYHIEVIDLMANPQLAATDQILAIPTLVRKLPAPMRKIIGDLSNTERVLVSLDIDIAQSIGADNVARKGA